MVRNVPQAQQQAAARELVEAWFLRQLDKTPGHLLCMGDVTNALLDDETLTTLASRNTQLDGIKVIRSAASVQVWASVDLKRQLWSLLAPLSQ